jgi:hypothetical protein
MRHSDIAWLIAFYVFFSFLEYAGHRWLMHRVRIATALGSEYLRRLGINHMAKHHKKPFCHDHDETDDEPLQLAFTAMLPGLLVAIPLELYDPHVVKLLMAFGAVYALVAWFAHKEMHLDKGRFYSGFFLFRYHKRRHIAHHEHPNKNFNVFLPLFDHVFGTVYRPKYATSNEADAANADLHAGAHQPVAKASPAAAPVAESRN